MGARVAALAALLAVASDVAAQASRREPPPSSATGLRMQETGIQGEKQRPDVLFVIPSGRGGPLVSARLRDYGFDIQEPLVKPWLEAELGLGRAQNQAGTQLDVDWREAIAGADVSVSGPAPVPMGSSLPPRSADPAPPAATDFRRSAPPSSMIPQTARSIPPPVAPAAPIDSPIYIPPAPAGRPSMNAVPSASVRPPASAIQLPGAGPSYERPR